jgi:hypothetical protein
MSGMVIGYKSVKKSSLRWFLKNTGKFPEEVYFSGICNIRYFSTYFTITEPEERFFFVVTDSARMEGTGTGKHCMNLDSEDFKFYNPLLNPSKPLFIDFIQKGYGH